MITSINLNTSYVEVKLGASTHKSLHTGDLNTSYVEVKRISVLLQSIRRCDLNTSYVEVKLKKNKNNKIKKVLFKYILC